MVLSALALAAAWRGPDVAWRGVPGAAVPQREVLATPQREVLVVYYSASNHSKLLANAIGDGARSVPSTNVRVPL